MFGGESGILVLLLRFTLLHAFVNRSENLKVCLTERKLSRPGGGCARFDFVDPVEKFRYGRVVTTRGLGRELHGGGLDFRDLLFFTTNGGADLVACSLHHEGAEVF